VSAITATRLIENVHSWVTAARLDAVADSAAPAELVIGERAHWRLSNAAGWVAVHRDQLLSKLYGLPVRREGGGDGWQLINAAGDVIAEGSITGP
jgi:hypothetical protein